MPAQFTSEPREVIGVGAQRARTLEWRYCFTRHLQRFVEFVVKNERGAEIAKVSARIVHATPTNALHNFSTHRNRVSHLALNEQILRQFHQREIELKRVAAGTHQRNQFFH